ncbi:hypothetical protein C8A00DRAFT_37895 [Chaetomidium leptoderma]|uniref:Uncharacterized protein n=1 Tax=Chaetomidium leptoderma TaxID=669021 RepID=A0AAN6VDR3_9PEZI|nr:hypothetical protein C8A00DRAFT_37895 [Chaetomidium leptoderma]
MDAAEMFKETKLKQGFVLATLISTVAGTFITSINLYDRLNEKRHQRKLDKGQNKRIKELEQRLNESEDEKKRIADGGKGGNDGNNDFRTSLQQSGNMVQHEYDRHFANLGPTFAQGDLLAQTQIQSQIILLQGTVIKLLEEALQTGTMPDISRLHNTLEFARESSIRALRDQYQRLLDSTPRQRQRRPNGPLRRTSSTPSLRDHASDSVWSHRRPPRKSLTQDRGGPLFCRCAEDLQRTDRPLDSCIVMDRSGARCADCSAGLGDADEVDGGRAWRVEKEVALRGGSSARGSDAGSESIVVRPYLLTRRFILKCHREGSGYACYLCFRYRDRDTLCRSEEDLVSHVTTKHSIGEYEGDRDIRDLNRTLPYR